MAPILRAQPDPPGTTSNLCAPTLRAPGGVSEPSAVAASASIPAGGAFPCQTLARRLPRALGAILEHMPDSITVARMVFQAQILVAHANERDAVLRLAADMCDEREVVRIALRPLKFVVGDVRVVDGAPDEVELSGFFAVRGAQLRDELRVGAPAIGCRAPALFPNARVFPCARGLPNACDFPLSAILSAISPSSAASTARKSAAHVFPHPSTIRRAAAR